MSAREFTVFLVMCLVWGFHFVVIKTAVADVPPLHYAAVRMALVALIMSPFLRWRPGEMGRVLIAGVCLGAFNYALLFTGIERATASASAIAVQLYPPFATILSVVFLKERVGWRRVGGMTLAFVGVVIIALNRQGGEAAPAQALGVSMVAAAMLSEAVGAILVKRATGFKPLQLLAWFAVMGTLVLFPLAYVFEGNEWAAFARADTTFLVGAIVYSAVGASVIGHTSYYWLLQRLPISTVAPSALLNAVFAVIFSVLILGEPFTPAFALGGALTLTGVGVIVVRAARKAEGADG